MGADRFRWELVSDGATAARAMSYDDLMELERLRAALSGLKHLRTALAGPNALLHTREGLRLAVLGEIDLILAHASGDGDP